MYVLDMDIIAWKNEISNVNFNQDLKDKIIGLFEQFSTIESLSFIKINDKTLSNAFNNINNYKPLTICLDIEFQSAIINKNAKSTPKYIHETNINNDHTAKFIREIGILFFIKDYDLSVYYIGHLLLNFKSLEHFGFDFDRMRSIGVNYSTVSNDTYEAMKTIENIFHLENIITPLNNEQLFKDKKKYGVRIKKIKKEVNSNYLFKKLLKKSVQSNINDIFNQIVGLNDFNDIQDKLKYIKRHLGSIQHEIYAKYLKKDDKLILNQLSELYWSDELVQNRLKFIDKKYGFFMSSFKYLTQQTVFVLKGRMDIVALKNTYMLINKADELQINNYYDIETFNGLSSFLYSSSQLENTYNGLIKTSLYDDTAKNFFDEIGKNIGNKAHNPVVDSLFTIVVAIVINLGLNVTFSKDVAKLNGGYRAQYLKYKHRYVELKMDLH